MWRRNPIREVEDGSSETRNGDFPLVGPQRRGLAKGLNSSFFVRETHGHARHEAKAQGREDARMPETLARRKKQGGGG